jgi:predicted methyltransferase
MKTILAYLSLALFISACGQEAGDEAAAPAAAPEPAAAPATSIYADAVASTTRLDGDSDRDAGRKPAEVLEFLGIARGASVLEMFASGGYYTELLAHVVGDTGHVVAHQNTPLMNFSGDAIKARHANNRLPNTEVLMAENNELALDADQFDAITIVLNYHDLYWVSEQYGWAEFDVASFLAELHKGLKPGGILGIVDHYAAPGSPAETGNTLHRIDPAVVIEEVQAAGFVLDGESDVLRNPEDDHSKSVFDPEIRGKTDRFVLRFKKPNT